MPKRASTIITVSIVTFQKETATVLLWHSLGNNLGESLSFTRKGTPKLLLVLDLPSEGRWVVLLKIENVVEGFSNWLHKKVLSLDAAILNPVVEPIQHLLVRGVSVLDSSYGERTNGVPLHINNEKQHNISFL